jgi:hypothetical protein
VILADEIYLFGMPNQKGSKRLRAEDLTSLFYSAVAILGDFTVHY